MPMEYIVPSLWIATFVDMADPEIMKERMSEIIAI